MLGIVEHKDFLSREESADVLANLFQVRSLWFDRTGHRGLTYRDSEWYTLGTTLYLDLLSKENVPKYAEMTSYFNCVLRAEFGSVLTDIASRLAHILKAKIAFLPDFYECSGLPGFHIFPPKKTMEYFFGRYHQDLQGRWLFQLPDFPFKLSDVTEHFSFTLPLKLPYLGGGLDLGNDVYYGYQECALYHHDGQMVHAIAASSAPVIECDWRITIQFHAFKINDTVYLYW